MVCATQFRTLLARPDNEMRPPTFRAAAALRVGLTRSPPRRGMTGICGVICSSASMSAIGESAIASTSASMARSRPSSFIIARTSFGGRIGLLAPIAAIISAISASLTGSSVALGCKLPRLARVTSGPNNHLWTRLHRRKSCRSPACSKRVRSSPSCTAVRRSESP